MDFRFACTAAVVVSGAYPLRAVGKTIAAAFCMEAVTFDYHPNKGPKMKLIGKDSWEHIALSCARCVF